MVLYLLILIDHLVFNEDNSGISSTDFYLFIYSRVIVSGHEIRQISQLSSKQNVDK